MLDRPHPTRRTQIRQFGPDNEAAVGPTVFPGEKNWGKCPFAPAPGFLNSLSADGGARFIVEWLLTAPVLIWSALATRSLLSSVAGWRG
jgi:hypothetical protein